MKLNEKIFEVNNNSPLSMAHLSVKMKEFERADNLKFISKSEEPIVGMTTNEWQIYLDNLQASLLIKEGRLDAYTSTTNYKTDRILAEIKRVNRHILNGNKPC